MPRLPDDTQREAIVGRTGSGKTQAGVYQLSRRSFDRIPWFVYDYKRDELLNEIPGVEHISTSDFPKHPGIYLIHPHPDAMEAVQKQMWKIWEREDTGLFIDEGYMVTNSRVPNAAFRSILTQGRSKHIPVITLSQRPLWLDRFVFSEADFFQVFALTDSSDRQAVKRFLPDVVNMDVPLPPYHSYYFDVGRNEIIVAKPVPTKDEILDTFASRFESMRHSGRVIVI